MKRFSLFLAILLGGVLLLGARGCSSDPNVEGAKLDLNNKDYDRALENIDKALETNPENAEAYQIKGRVLQEKAFAVRDVEEHNTLFRGMIEAYQRAQELDPALGSDVDNRLNIAYFSEFQRGVEAFNRGQNTENGSAEFGAAADYFGNASLIFPDSASTYVNQAFALLNGGRNAEAIQPLESAIEKGDTSEDTFVYLATLYGEQEKYENVIAVLEKARAVYPESEQIQTLMMNAYVVSGKTDEALGVYRSAVENEPDNKLYRYNYGSILLEMEDYDGAIEQLAKAAEIDPEYANAQYNLGAAYVNKAVAINAQYNEIDDNLREKRADLSADEISAMEAQLDELSTQRRGLFEQAIAPLERAREVSEAQGADLQGICQALYQAYGQTNQIEKAEAVAECAGYDL
ncbi:MAG: tetratricopeptide repeat protein [Rhodothermales bacterium]